MDKNDVLQQQKEEIQLQAAELEKLSIVASETDNAVMIMDADGTFEWVNEGFTKMYGYTLEQLKLFRGSSIFDSTGNKHLLELIESGEVNKEPIIYESLCHTKSGEKIWAQTTITPVLDENGSIVKLVAIDSNIHQMKLAEEEIRQAKEEIEAQRDEIQEQKNLVDEKNKDITDSINYAKNIQNAILPDISIIQRNFPDTFVLFKPRDIVSGDFYWYNESEQYAYFAAIDCTGHGVPGAFMSMLGFAFLNEIVNKDSVFEPDDILNRLRGLIVKSLHQEGKTTDSKDGMDVVLCVVDKQNNKLYFSGANNPLYLIRNNELNEYKGDKMPIAYHLRMDPFAKLEIEIQKGDTFYFFSDGFADQFGGPKGKKFMYKHLKTLLLEIQEKPMQEQNAFLVTTIEDWKAHIDPDTGHYYEQVDDIVIIGPKTGTSTDVNGKYSISLKPGEYEVTYKFIGYAPEVKKIKLKDGEVRVMDVSMHVEIHTINEIVVSAGKFEQRLSDVTVSLEVMKPARVESMNTTNLDEAINQIPGVEISGEQPSIRGGSGYSYGAGTRVLVLVDDLPLLSPSSADPKWNFLPVENISQIEVLKGASSSLFGSSALNGVINIRTAYPGEKPETKISTFMGTYMRPQRTALVRDRNAPQSMMGTNFLHSRKIGNLDLVVGGNLFSDDSYREKEFEKYGRLNANIRYRDKKIQGLSYGVNTNYMYQDKQEFFLWRHADSAYHQNLSAVTEIQGS